MKVLPTLALAAALLGSGAAFADRAVKIPADLGDPAQAAAYTKALNRAVRIECARAATPVIGVNYYSYAACVKATKVAVAKSDPTGLYASATGLTRTLASK